MSIKLVKKKVVGTLVPDVHVHERAPRPATVIYYDPPNIIIGSASIDRSIGWQ